MSQYKIKVVSTFTLECDDVPGDEDIINECRHYPGILLASLDVLSSEAVLE